MARTFGTRRRPGRRREPEASPWPFVLSVFVVSRVFFLGVGALAAEFLPWAEPAGDPLEPPGFLSYWAHWDGAWFAEIATQGYAERAPASTVFFPLYPMLVRLGTLLGGGPALWGVAISLAATLFALYFLYGISEKLHGTNAARAAVLTMAFFPTAFFMNAVYSEALFIALTTGCVWAAYVRRNLFLAGLLGALAAATRNLGVLLVVPLLWEWFRSRREFGGKEVGGVFLIPAGLLAYAIFLGGKFEEPLVFARQQQDYWARTLTSPLLTLQQAWDAAGEGARNLLDPRALLLGPSSIPALEASNTLSFAFLVLFVALMAVGLAVLPPGLSVYSLAVALLPMLAPSSSFPLMSLPRFMLAAFPVFLVLGYLLSRSRTALVLWLVLSIALGAALTAMFTTWRWVA